MEKKRVEFIDLAKGICILLVVFEHATTAFGFSDYFFKTELTAFRMPLYFFLSGLFFREYKGFLDFTIRKINKLLIPFVTFFISTSCALPFLLGSLGLRKSPTSEVWFSFVFQESFPNVPIWFLLSLFWTNLFFYLLFVLSRFVKNNAPCFGKISQDVFLFLFCGTLGILGAYLGLYSVNFPMFLDSSMSSIPFFCVGYLTVRHSKFLEKKDSLFKTTIGFVLCGVVLYLTCPESVSLRQNVMSEPLWIIYAAGLSGTFSVMFLSKIFVRLPLVSYFGRYSIMILLTHGWLLWICMKVSYSFHFYPKNLLPIILVFFITMVSYLLWIPFMKRFLPYVTAQKNLIPLKKV